VRNFSRELFEKDKRKVFDRMEGEGVKIFFKICERRSEFDVRLGMYDGKKYQIIRADEKEVKEISENRGRDRRA